MRTRIVTSLRMMLFYVDDNHVNGDDDCDGGGDTNKS